MSDETQHVPDGPLPAKLASAIQGDSAASAGANGPKFGRFQTTSTLGAGAMGTVYRAHDPMLGRDVAIKTLTGNGELGVRERFLREARAIGAVHHPNILAVHDVGEEGGTPYLVMELAAGGSLRDRTKAGPLPVETVRDVGIHIARALAAAHAANIVHRDVKPANILCATPAGQAPLWKLADFGIAHLPDSTLTMTGQFLGSPSYAAPESLRAGEFGPSSDVYGLGVTLYEALAGSTPHGDHDMQSIIRKLEHDPLPLHTRTSSAPPALTNAIMAALARDPAQRPSADELARMLAEDRDVAVAPVVPVARAAPASSLASAAPASSLTSAGGPAVVSAGSAASGNRSMKLLALGLLGIAALAIFLAVRGDHAPSNAARPSIAPGLQPAHGGQSADSESGAAGAYDDEASGPTPMVVDQYGNPVDEETARQILEQMEEDAREASERGPGRGRGKGRKKHKD